MVEEHVHDDDEGVVLYPCELEHLPHVRDVENVLMRGNINDYVEVYVSLRCKPSLNILIVVVHRGLIAADGVAIQESIKVLIFEVAE